MLALVSALAVLLGAPGPVRVREAVQEVYEGEGYQRKLPLPDPKESNKLSPEELRQRRERRERRIREIMKRRRERDRQRAPQTSGRGFGSFATVLLWVLMAAAAVILAIFIARDFLGFFPEDEEEDGETEGAKKSPDRRVVDRPLDDAQALAASGRYQEAIHTLLLQTLIELSRKLPEPLAPSLTSREVLLALQLGPEEHGALTGLITAVELTHFGAETPSLDDYERCLYHFQSFAGAYLRRGA
jgi:hypothetical protein